MYWFKKERGQIFGEERGQWLIDDIECTELNDKLSIKVQCHSRNDTTLLRANSEHEYTIWCNALRDVILNKGDNQNTVKLTAHRRELSDEYNTSQQSHSQYPTKSVDTAQHSDYTSEPDTPVAYNSARTTSNNNSNNDNNSLQYPSHTPTINSIPTANRQVSDSSITLPSSASVSDMPQSVRPVTVNRPGRSYSRARAINSMSHNSSSMQPPTSPVVRHRNRSLSSVGEVIDPLLLVMIEKSDNNTVISSQMRPGLFSSAKPSLNAVRRGNILLGSGGVELVVARNVPWAQTIHVPNFTHNDILYGVLGDGSKVKVKHDDLINSSGEKLFSIDDPYRSADVLIKWQRVKPNYSIIQAFNYSTFIVLPLIYVSLLVLYCISNYFSTTYNDNYSISDSVCCTQGALVLIGCCNAIYAGTDAVRRANGNRQQRMWLFTFVSLHESLMPKQPLSATNTNNKLLSAINPTISTHANELRSNNPALIQMQSRPPTSPSSKPSSSKKSAQAQSPTKLKAPKPLLRETSDNEPHRAQGRTSGSHSKNKISNSLLNNTVITPISPSSRSSGATSNNIQTINNNMTADIQSDDALDDDDTYAVAVRNGVIDLDATDVEYEPIEQTNGIITENRQTIHNITQSHIAISGDTNNITYQSLSDFTDHIVQLEQQAIKYYETASLPSSTSEVWGSWTEPDLSVISVRGQTFLDDKKKITAGISMFKLLHVDMFYSTTDKFSRVCTRPDNYSYQYYEKYKNNTLDPTIDDGKLNPLFIINFVYPGPESRNMTITCYYQRQIRTAHMIEQSIAQNDGSTTAHELIELDRIRAYDQLLSDFINGSDEYRDGRFKIIARIAEGSWVVKKGVGATPAILGRKIKQYYYYDPKRNIFELDVDVGSSMVAGKILSLVKSAALSLTIDMTFILQGESYSELAESVMCGVRVEHVDLMKIQPVEQNSLNYKL